MSRSVTDHYPIAQKPNSMLDVLDYCIILLYFVLCLFTGSVYMNGDVAKVPSGAVFTATPEPHAPSPTTDFK